MDIISKERLVEITSNFSKLSPICVVGDIGVDKYTYGNVNRISPEAPVPVLEVTKEWMKLGLASNISHNLQTLGVQSTLVGLIGEDKNADIVENLLEECKLKTWGLVREESRPTIYKERVTTQTQQICRIDYEKKSQVSEDVAQKLFDRVSDFYNEHNSLLIEDYGKGTMHTSTIQKLINKFVSDNKIVTVDPSRWTDPLAYKNCTLLKPNQVEAQILVEALGYREQSIEQMADILVDKLNLEKIIITLGGNGMALVDTKSNNSIEFIPTVATEVFDVSGAGDTAMSALTAALLSGASLKEAAWIGNCASGVVVGKKGTATVNIDELLDYHQMLVAKFVD